MSNRTHTNMHQTTIDKHTPVQQLPVLSSPAVSEVMCVHASCSIQVRLIDPQQTKPIHLPVTWNTARDEREIKRGGSVCVYISGGW